MMYYILLPEIQMKLLIIMKKNDSKYQKIDIISTINYKTT